MVFSPRQRKQTFDIYIQIGNNAVERLTEIVFLGVILDEQLMSNCQGGLTILAFLEKYQ